MLGKIEGRRRRVQQRISWLNGITDSMNMSLNKLRVWGGLSSVHLESVPKEACGFLFHSSRVSGYAFHGHGHGHGGADSEVDGQELLDPKPGEES